MIEIKNVSKSFDSLKVLDDVSLTIHDGEIFGVIGQSGAGKSTLLRTLNGLIPIDKGQILIDGKDIAQMKGAELRSFRKKTAMIFQDFALLETESVYKNIALPLICSHEKRADIDKKVRELSRLVGIEDKLKMKPRELSGGQKQRVAIARALTLNPKILLSDEATSALDPKTTSSILALLSDINKKMGLTIVVVTHQMEVIKAICSKVALIVDGKIKECGSTDEIFLNPNSAIASIVSQDEILPDTGTNIRLYFPKSFSQEDFITNMARSLDVNFAIVWGKLERFREDVLGTLIINVKDESLEKIVSYLNQSKISYEVIKNEH